MRYGQQLASQPQRENLTLVMDLVTREFGNKGKGEGRGRTYREGWHLSMKSRIREGQRHCCVKEC